MDPGSRPYATAAVPPVRAIFKGTDEDFEIDEVAGPAPPAGAHLRVRIEKRGISTEEAIRRIARALGRREGEVGYAGRKDARGVARQWISIEGVAPEDLARIDDPAVRVLEHAPADRKLRAGDLAGNRFAIRLREVSEEDERRAREAAGILAARGVPSWFGAQRFGIRGDSDAIGRAILLGRWKEALQRLLGGPDPREGPRLRGAREAVERNELRRALELFPAKFEPERRALAALIAGASFERAVAALPFRTRELYIHAYQAALFNRILAERVRAGTYGALEPGDLAIDHATGELVPIDDPAAFAARVETIELSPTGPLFGHAAPRPKGAPREREDAVLRAEGIGYETWAKPRGLAMRGARRALRFALREVEIERDGRDLVMRFVLGPGEYATAVIDEILKRRIG